MHLQTLLTLTLFTSGTTLTHPTLPETNRSETDTKSAAYEDTRREGSDHSIAHDLVLPAGINSPIPLSDSPSPGITIPPPTPLAFPSAAPVISNPAPAAPTIGGPLQFSSPLVPTATQNPGTTTLAVLSFPGVAVVSFTVTTFGPESFSGIATPVGSAVVINPAPER